LALSTLDFPPLGCSYWNRASAIHFCPAKVQLTRRLNMNLLGAPALPGNGRATLICSAGWQPAVSADWQSADCRILEPAADCQSAIRQTASLRYRGRGSAAPGFSVVEKI